MTSAKATQTLTLDEYLELPPTVDAAWWSERTAEAENLMAGRSANSAVLIVVAAQHPLVCGMTPGAEFAARLDEGKKRAEELLAEGRETEIFVPGSRHMDSGVADKIALAEAGAQYLAKSGLDKSVALLGMGLVDKYKGDEGVYNGADEAFVAASYFKDSAKFGTLELFCASGQAERWRLQAIANGVVPAIHLVAPEGVELYHAGRGGANDKVLLYTKFYDPTWQSRDSFLGNLTRRQRRPA